MFAVDCTIEGLPEFLASYATAVDELESDFRDGALQAATDGIDEAKQNHPYTDRTHVLTGDAHAVPLKDRDGAGIAEMVWTAEYAGFVDKGTSRNQAYPFTPQARFIANASLEHSTEVSIGRFERRASDL